jgi:hypothetical protein
LFMFFEIFQAGQPLFKGHFVGESGGVCAAVTEGQLDVQVRVLDSAGDQTAWAAADEPGEGAPSARTCCVRSCSCSDFPGGSLEPIFAVGVASCVAFNVRACDRYHHVEAGAQPAAVLA